MKNYEPCARNGISLSFFWKTWQPGERKYDVSTDSFVVCVAADTRLEANIDIVDEAFGKTPQEQGYVEPLLVGSGKWVRESGSFCGVRVPDEYGH